MTTLLAVTGLSPAIVTETIFALAREKPAVLPERVAFITTLTGAAKLQEQLFTPLLEWGNNTVWESLRRILGTNDRQLIAEAPRIIHYPNAREGRTAPLEDIVTPNDNHAAAECIFAAVWDIVRDRNNHLIASIAGGRKTMGALLHSAVSLIGRENDRLTHILVDPPFDTLPGFFFPSQPGSPLLSREGRAYEASSARLHLADLPFVSLRNKFRELDELPGSYLDLRDSLARRLQQESAREIPIRIDHRSGTLHVDDTPYPVRARALAILHFILECNLKDQIPRDQISAATAFQSWYDQKRATLGHIDHPNFDESDFRRELHHLRDILAKAPWSPTRRTLRQAPFRLIE